WATGPALGLLLFGASAAALVKGLLVLEAPEERATYGRLVALLLPVVALLVAQFTRPVATVRYAHPALPLLVAAAAAALPSLLPRYARLVAGLAVIGTALAGFALLSIYSKETTRVTATRRLAALFPKGATVGFEHWDDPIPLMLPGVPWRSFTGVEMPVFDPDSPEKAGKLLDALERADAIVVTSRRGFGTVTRLPDTFPATSEYYRLLYSGALGFDLAERDESRPGIGRFRLDDRDAEEALSVYDHPQVLIFRKTARYDRANAERLLVRVTGEPPDESTPRTALARGTAPDLTPEERAKGVSTPPPPKRRGIAGQLVSLGAWLLALELLGTFGATLLGPMRTRFPAPAAFAARPLGFALAGLSWSWLGFLVPGFQWLALPVFLAGAFLVVFVPKGRQAFQSIGGRPRAVFLGVFGFFLLVRAFNPEVFWGEKPMDGALLGAAIRAPRLPLAEPWFAGAPLDYYGHGFLPVALLSHATGASPGLAFNFATATLPALLGVSVFGAGLLLSESAVGGAAALVLVLLSGTLAPLFNAAFRAAPFSFDGFWAASRVIPDAINEFPLFTALFADLHAHLLGWAPLGAMVLLALARRSSSGAATKVEAILLGLLGAA
ncbi:MAG TPA: DUF2298 domain-containing protein, partial [Thermoanaerobaculia bacterium]|nr:DUF2298 domain-containing protein [Thermoanaerobaculia bacterium]